MSKDKGQIIFEQEDQNTNTSPPLKHMNLIQEESLFDIILNNYSSHNIEIEKITPRQFSELIIPEYKIILDQYKDKLDEISSDLINKNTLMGPLKFMDEKNKNNNFYYKGEFNNEGIINGRGIKIIPNNRYLTDNNKSIINIRSNAPNTLFKSIKTGKNLSPMKLNHSRKEKDVNYEFYPLTKELNTNLKKDFNEKLLDRTIYDIYI